MAAEPDGLVSLTGFQARQVQTPDRSEPRLKATSKQGGNARAAEHLSDLRRDLLQADLSAGA